METYRKYLNEVRDEDNPDYMFQMTSIKLLTAAVNGKIDLMEKVKQELASRGLDKKGKWIGYEEAKKLYGLK